jgi:hypothetical protein
MTVLIRYLETNLSISRESRKRKRRRLLVRSCLLVFFSCFYFLSSKWKLRVCQGGGVSRCVGNLSWFLSFFPSSRVVLDMLAGLDTVKADNPLYCLFMLIAVGHINTPVHLR